MAVSAVPKRPVIAIDARMLGPHGIGTYLMALLRAFASINHEFQFRVICSRPDLINGLPGSKFQFVAGASPIYSLKEQWEIARLAQGTDLLHCPHYNVPYFYRRRLVVTIHDLTHLTCPQFLPNRAARLYASLMYRAAARHAMRIITDSHFSGDLIRERLHISKDKIRVIHPGLPEGYGRDNARTDPSRLQELGIRRRYVLSVGLLKRHKNFERLLRAFALLPARLRERYQIVIVGKKDVAYPDLVRLTKEQSLEENVVFTGSVSDPDLQILYSSSALFALPSLNEGFGLPALEAMAHGVPVVVSNVSSLPEVVGDAGRLVNPQNECEIAAAIEELLTNDDLRHNLIERSKKRAQLFSAERAALDHLEVYRSALAEESPRFLSPSSSRVHSIGNSGSSRSGKALPSLRAKCSASRIM